ncbi:hypothetical protein SEA_ALEEMILY_116 [Gordonia phage Aleemily]|uniref:Uncharacterized protein n=2 Tax=Cafassovirus TaxID=3425056 RepID=A0A9E7QCF7_9CAUD|nr:hypothetical protein SEA_ALEEMILY_116 [Gordonia phage Aleemily]
MTDDDGRRVGAFAAAEEAACDPDGYLDELMAMLAVIRGVDF